MATWQSSGSPVIKDNDVVLPAPFGPTSPAKEPAAISRSIPATACFAPKLLRSSCTAMAGSRMSASPPAGSVLTRTSARAGPPRRGLGQRRCLFPAYLGHGLRRAAADAREVEVAVRHADILGEPYRHPGGPQSGGVARAILEQR